MGRALKRKTGCPAHYRTNNNALEVYALGFSMKKTEKEKSAWFI